MRLGPEEVISLERVEVEEEDGEDSEGEGTGSTELSDIRLLGRCEREGDRWWTGERVLGTSSITNSFLISCTEIVYLPLDL